MPVEQKTNKLGGRLAVAGLRKLSSFLQKKGAQYRSSLRQRSFGRSDHGRTSWLGPTILFVL